MLKYALLGFLNYQPMTGYELENFINVSTGNFWHARLSQIYMTLKQLEQKELVTSVIEPQESRPDRRVYTITTSGIDDLHHWLAQPLLELEPEKETLLLKLFFARPNGKQSILTQLRIQMELHRQQLDKYEHYTHPQKIDLVHENPELIEDSLLWERTLRFGVMYEQMYVEWLQESIEKLDRELSD